VFNSVVSNFNNTDQSFKALSLVMDDSTGRPVAPSPLSASARDWSKLVPINGTRTNAGGTGTAVDYIATGHRTTALGHLSLPAWNADATDINNMIKGTNPSRPVVTPLSLVQDVLDIPRQLAEAKYLFSPFIKRRLSAKQLANQALGIQFGWLPLIQDVQSLIDLQASIHRRVGELHSLYGTGGLKRRISFGTHSASSGTKNVSYESSSLLNYNVNVSTSSMSRRWGTVRWLPSVLPSWRLNDRELIFQAKRIALGITPEGLYAGAWDLLPWTWLLDWFTNIGTFMLEYSNTVPAVSSGACIMTQTDSRFDYTVASLTSGYTGGGGSATYTTKVRSTGVTSITASIPFIGVDRLSILEALFVQRFKRVGRI
jgi:hypothetical protein